MKRAAVGFRVHSGWAAMVALTLNNGTPTILVRERVHLIETFTYPFRQPYHTAEKMPLKKAAAFIERVRDEAQQVALGIVRKLATDLRAQDCKLTACGVLLSSGRIVANLAQILASHASIHTADGQLFREAILHAAKRCRLVRFSIRERNILGAASKDLRIESDDLARRVAELGRPLGPPWSQDEKLATIVALLAANSARFNPI
ncbi:MAG TPA: hypothetical protein VMM16_04355 [Verrucomicrobiae bacterium]|nr:hypothetical protein [Verrucomicrobiae bacterium]